MPARPKPARTAAPASRRRGTRAQSPASLSADLAALERATLQQLRLRWQGLTGRPAPRCFRRELLMHAIGHELQVVEQGDVPSAVRRYLADVALNANTPADRSVAPLTPAPRLTAGSRLVRVWQGRTYEIEVLGEGYGWQGRIWRSLSRIAREITGTRWNGLLFFGLRTPPASAVQRPQARKTDDAGASP